MRLLNLGVILGLTMGVFSLAGCQGDLLVPVPVEERRELAPNPEPQPREVEIPAAWVCDEASYGQDDGCDCGCGVVDENCDETMACATVHCGEGQRINPENPAECEEHLVVPSAWACVDEAYGNQNGCDCGCGMFDEECDATMACAEIHCPEGEELHPDDKTRCRVIEVEPPTAPDAWTCADDTFADGVCDCGCDAADLDCEGVVCERSHCEEGFEVSQSDASLCSRVYPDVPSTWTCTDTLYARNDICDCGCGAIDPDCIDERACVSHCAEGFIIDEDNKASCVVAPPIVPQTWSCEESRYFDATCDCGCGAPDLDCQQNPTCERSNCPEGQEVHPSLQTECRVPPLTLPAAWTCQPLVYGSDVCDCGCGAPDPDCLGEGECARDNCQVGYVHDTSAWETCVVALPTPPSTWTCDATQYGSGDMCDCGCGANDLDCLGGSCERDNCAEGFEVNPLNVSQCQEQTPNAPSDWTCDPLQYARDVCDCGCGVADPDCDGGALCARVHCEGGLVVDQSDQTQCTEPPPMVPSDWTCTNFAFNNDICDCGCGASDVDCGPTDVCVVEHCPTGLIVDPNDNTRCIEPAPMVPNGWTCDDALYQNATCDCGCGVVDSDCLPDLACVIDHCASGLVVDPDDSSACVTPEPGVPSGFTCDESLYANGSCDCGCGVIDSDCSAGQACTSSHCEAGYSIDPNNSALCLEDPPEPPASWTCEAERYDVNGICDCGCGAADPDCVGAPSCGASHCGTGLVVDSDDWSACIGEPDNGVPSEWTCVETYYGTSDGCDCGCGVSDPDCGVPVTCDFSYCIAPEVVSPDDASQCIDPNAAVEFAGVKIENLQNPASVQSATLSTLWLRPGDVVVIARRADKAAFEAHWNVTLGTNVTFINQNQSGSSGVPIINGDEVFRLVDANGVVLDGPIGPGEATKAFFQRDDGWFFWDETNATPGTSELTTAGGLQLSEWSDGNNVYQMEYVELVYIP